MINNIETCVLTTPSLHHLIPTLISGNYNRIDVLNTAKVILIAEALNVKTQQVINAIDSYKSKMSDALCSINERTRAPYNTSVGFSNTLNLVASYYLDVPAVEDLRMEACTELGKELLELKEFKQPIEVIALVHEVLMANVLP